MTYPTTPHDHLLRAEICDTILLGLCEDPDFGEQKDFAKWCKNHKPLLLSLFGGSGINRLARVVAWARREAYKARREPPEVLSILAQGYDDGLPSSLLGALDDLGITSKTDLIRAAMLEAEFAKEMFRPAPGGIDAIIAQYAKMPANGEAGISEKTSL